jgi:hypothetical protein
MLACDKGALRLPMHSPRCRIERNRPRGPFHHAFALGLLLMLQRVLALFQGNIVALRANLQPVADA